MALGDLNGAAASAVERREPLRSGSPGFWTATDILTRYTVAAAVGVEPIAKQSFRARGDWNVDTTRWNLGLARHVYNWHVLARTISQHEGLAARGNVLGWGAALECRSREGRAVETISPRFCTQNWRYEP